MFDFLFKGLGPSPFEGGPGPLPQPAPGPNKSQPPPALKPIQPSPEAGEGAKPAASGDDLADMYGSGSDPSVSSYAPQAPKPGEKPGDEEKQFEVSKNPYLKNMQLREAEKDRAKLEENLKALPGLTDAEKQRILDHVKDLKGDALIKEQHALTHALTQDEAGHYGANAEAALGAYADAVGVINGGIKQNFEGENSGDIVHRWEKARERIDSDMLSTIVTGVADQKETGECASTDTRGNLSRRGARDATQAIINMPDEEFKSVKEGLDHVKREPDTTGPDGKVMKGLPVDADDATARQAVLLQAVAARRDKFDRVSTNRDQNDPSYSREGSKEGKDTAAEISEFADKLQGMTKYNIVGAISTKYIAQEYQNTCAQTTAQVQHADSDPIYAMKLHDDPNFAAKEQKRLHEESAPGATVRARDGSEEKKPGSHITTNISHSLDEVADSTHLKYKRGADGLYGEAASKEKEADQTKRLEGALKDGQTVPIRVADEKDNGHSMSVSNVRGEGAAKQYYVHDPLSGLSKWVSEQSFHDGTFVDDFGVPHPGMKVHLSDLYIGEND